MIKAANLKKSILDYAIKGELSAGFRRNYQGKSALEEIEIFNANTLKIKTQREKLLSKLEIIAKTEKNNNRKSRIKNLITSLKNKIKSYKLITPLSFNNDFIPPFDIPSNWAWVKLGEIFQHNTGKALNRANQTGKLLKYITTSNLYWNYFELSNIRQMYFNDSEIEKCTVKKGDLLVCEGGDIGRSAIWNYDENICIQNHIHRLRPYMQVCIEYFYYLFYFYKQIDLIGGKGIGIQGLSSNALHSIQFPLPPLSEQCHIAGLLEELLEKCKDYEQEADRLEEIQGKLKKQLPKSLLDYAIKGQLSAGFRRNYQGLSALDEIKLFNDKTSKIKQQREILLNKLEILLKNEKNNQRKLKIKNVITSLKNKIKSYEIITPLNSNPDFIPPFDIPSNWAWVKLGEICDIKLGKTPAKDNGSYWTLNPSGYKWVSIGDMIDKAVIENTEKFITEKAKNEVFGNSIVKKGSLILSFKLTIGKTSILGFDGFHNEAIATITPKLDNKEIIKNFLLNFLEVFTKFSNSTSAIKGETLNKDKLNNLPLPLPSLSEQDYIALQLEKLMQLAVRS